MTTAGATPTVATSPTCGLTGCGVKVGKGGLCTVKKGEIQGNPSKAEQKGDESEEKLRKR